MALAEPRSLLACIYVSATKNRGKRVHFEPEQREIDAVGGFGTFQPLNCPILTYSQYAHYVLNPYF
jgi:hypothetical protein